MPIKNLFRLSVSLILSIGILVFTLNWLTKHPAVTVTVSEIAPAVVSADSLGNDDPKIINEGEVIAGLQDVSFGRFVKLRLTPESSITLSKVDFLPGTDLITEAEVVITNGRIWLSDNTLGSIFTIRDERLTATSHGGTIDFEKNTSTDGESFTRLTAIGGTLKVALNGSAEFSTVLQPGKSITITDSQVVGINATADILSRTFAWQEIVTDKKPDRFTKANEQKDSELVKEQLEKLKKHYAKGNQPNWLTELRKFLTFVPVARDRFWAQESVRLIGDTLQTGSNWQMIADSKNSDTFAKERLEAELRWLAPYTRLLPTKLLITRTKQEITKLNNLEPDIIELANLTQLPKTLSLEKKLFFADSELSSNPNLSKPYLSQYLATLSKISELNATDIQIHQKHLLGILNSRTSLMSEDLLQTYRELRARRTTSELEIADQILDQLSLANLLINTNRQSLGKMALQELVQLLKSGTDRFTAGSLSLAAAKGEDLKNRLLYLTSLHSSASSNPIDAESYAIWLEEKLSREETERLTDDDKVSRPPDAFTRFMQSFEISTEKNSDSKSGVTN